MCYQFLPLLLSAGGAVMQHKAANDLADDQARAAAEGIIKSAALNREADTRVSQAVGEVAASNPDAERAAKRATYTDALRKSLNTRAGAIPTAGAVSSRFADESADARANTEAEALQNADMTAAVEAPTYQRLNEGKTLNNAGVDLSLLKGRAQGEDYLTRLRVAMQKPNQWLTAGGQLLSGAGSALAAGGGFGGGDSVWDDGSAMSGLTADQRRNAWMNTSASNGTPKYRASRGKP